MKNRSINAGDNWATPPELYNALHEEFDFDHDPCPLFTGCTIPPDKDGLLTEWGYRNFVNPPYSLNLKTAFVKRAVEMKQRGRLSVLLLPVSTSTKLFHDTIQPNATDIRFLRGRVKFIGVNTFGERVTNKCGMHDSMVVVLHPHR